MTRALRIPAVAVLALFTTVPSLVAAWGPDGHKIVCAIAYDLLAAAEQAEVRRLTAAYRTPDGMTYRRFPAACNFADIARRKAKDAARGWEHFERFANWHFLNVPRDSRRVEARYCHQDCVLEGLRFHGRRLADRSLPDPERAEALLFVGHWVADVHQPLHISFADDRGGNQIALTGRRYYRSANLHALWDSGIVHRAMQKLPWWEYKDRLERRITDDLRARWRSLRVLDWVQESYDITLSPAVGYCEMRTRGGVERCESAPRVRRPGPTYQAAFQPVVERRLQQAGVRLARFLAPRLQGR